MKITRRQLAATAAASTAASAMLAATRTANAQTPVNPSPPKPLTPEEDVTAAKDQIHRNSEALAKFQIPMSTEPAFKFTV